MRRRTRRSGGGGPSRTWISLNDSWNVSGLTGTTATSLMSLQAPTTLTLTSDPPEDIVVDRIVGNFNVVITGSGLWTLSLIVQDTSWTPSSTFASDADKRTLWSMTYDTVTIATTAALAGFTFAAWTQPGTMVINATTDIVTNAGRETSFVDISPKVRIEPGKALYLVAYEESGTATFQSIATNVRLLFHRARRSR